MHGRDEHDAQHSSESKIDCFEVSDPSVVRLISHPIRYAALQELFDRQEPRTATQIAEVVGVTPSAMSYHLRMLSKVGIVRRATSLRDGRECPWEPSARRYHVVVTRDPDPKARMRLMDAVLVPLRRRIEHMLDTHASPSRMRRHSSIPISNASSERSRSASDPHPAVETPTSVRSANGDSEDVAADDPQSMNPFTLLSTGNLTLTWDEAVQAQREIREVWQRYERLSSGRKPSRYPVNAVFVWSCLPDEFNDEDSRASRRPQRK